MSGNLCCFFKDALEKKSHYAIIRIAFWDTISEKI